MMMALMTICSQQTGSGLKAFSFAKTCSCHPFPNAICLCKNWLEVKENESGRKVLMA